jgi:LysR family nitrogen assimilation transcriptional regulator
LMAVAGEKRMESMDLKQIRCFVAAYEEGSFSKAAKREHCTQPGLSVYIQRLETMLSHKLFERNAVGVTPTVAGKHFYAACTNVLKAVKAAKQTMLDMAGNVAGTINVGVIPSIFKGAVATMLPGYIADHPYISVRIAEAYSGSLADWVASGEVEVAIVNRPSVHLGLDVTHFFRDRLVVVKRPDGVSHKKGKRPRTIEVNDLESLKLILPSPKHTLRQMIENVLRPGEGASGKILEIDGMLGTLELVRNSDWATIVPRVAVINEVRQGKLAAQPIANPELWIDFFLVQTNNSLLSLPCRDFLSKVRQTLEQVANTNQALQ